MDKVNKLKDSLVKYREEVKNGTYIAKPKKEKKITRSIAIVNYCKECQCCKDGEKYKSIISNCTAKNCKLFNVRIQHRLDKKSINPCNGIPEELDMSNLQEIRVISEVVKDLNSSTNKPKAVKEYCTSCIYDDQAKGTCLEQITKCKFKTCPLYAFRPLTKSIRLKSKVTS